LFCFDSPFDTTFDMILIVQENDSLNVFNDNVIRYGYGQLKYVAFKEALDDCDKNVESFKNKLFAT
jgi:hypothetical protein